MDVNPDCGLEVPWCCRRSKRSGLICFFFITAMLVCVQEDLRCLTLRYGSSLGIVDEAFAVHKHQGVGNVSDFMTR
jgi:hypothetical protein